MKNSKTILFAFCSIVIYSCVGNKNANDSLIFKDRVSNVQTILIEMEKLIRKLPPNSDNFNKNYEYNTDSLTVNNVSNLRKDIYSKNALNSLNDNERLIS